MSQEIRFAGLSFYTLSTCKFGKLHDSVAKLSVAMRTVFWFRKGLRLHDNPALVAALEGCTTLYPVFCLDPWFVSSGKVGTNRMRFLLEVWPSREPCLLLTSAPDRTRACG